jgi:hypothetical protein
VLYQRSGEPDDPGLVDDHVARLGDVEPGELAQASVVAPEAIVVEVGEPDLLAVHRRVAGDRVRIGISIGSSISPDVVIRPRTGLFDV